MVTQEHDKYMQTIYIRSDEPKPSVAQNGDCIIEVDTGKPYRFDAENAVWRNIRSGGGDGGDGGSGGVRNYLTSDIEVGTIDASGVNGNNQSRLRTKDFTALEAGTYTVFCTSDLLVIVFRYTTDGTFIDRTSSYFKQMPLSFTAEEGQKFRFAFNSPNGDPLSTSDMKNLVLLKN